MEEQARLRALLEERRAHAATRVAASDAALAALLHDREGSNDDDEHDPEGVTLSSEWSRLRALADDAAAELRQVEEALSRQTDGTYGSCARCGRPIPIARLEVRPFAEHCVDCATALGR